MKKLIIFLCVLYTNLALAEIGLYTSESLSSRPVNEMNEILERFVKENPEKNIVFYVHGRNHHVEKEWKKLQVMESTYNVKVVMLHWNAWSSMISRAVAGAEEAAGPLSEAFREIREFKESHMEFFESKKISLLCHSMGNLVLKNFTEKYLANNQYNLEAPLFENYLGVSADVPLKDHREWLSKFNLAKNKNIVMNNRDIVLLLSYTLDLTAKNPFQYRLGLGFDNYPGKKDQIKSKLVPDVTYIDLSGVLESQHGYFLPKTKVMKTIFSRLTNGEPFHIADDESSLLKVKLKSENNIVYIKDK